MERITGSRFQSPSGRSFLCLSLSENSLLLSNSGVIRFCCLAAKNRDNQWKTRTFVSYLVIDVFSLHFRRDNDVVDLILWFCVCMWANSAQIRAVREICIKATEKKRRPEMACMNIEPSRKWNRIGGVAIWNARAWCENSQWHGMVSLHDILSLLQCSIQ